MNFVILKFYSDVAHALWRSFQAHRRLVPLCAI
jgi:hypothetical protein